MRAILKLINDKLAYWICTSSGNDKTRIEQMKKDNPDLSTMDVLKLLAFENEEVS